MIDCPIFVLAVKLKIEKYVLKKWNREIFRKVNYQLLSYLNDTHMFMNNVGYNDLLKEEEIKVKLNIWMRLSIWRTKIWKNNWFNNGNKNTRVFHSIVKLKHAKITIARLKHG